MEFCHRVGMTYVSCSPYWSPSPGSPRPRPVKELRASQGGPGPASRHRGRQGRERAAVGGSCGAGGPRHERARAASSSPVADAVPRRRRRRSTGSRANVRRWNDDAARRLRGAGLHRGVPAALGGRARAPCSWRRARRSPAHRVMIAGTGHDSTLLTIRQTRRAAEIGADAALVITPHYFTRRSMQPPAQVRHYRTGRRGSPIPVMIYNYPGQHRDQPRRPTRWRGSRSTRTSAGSRTPPATSRRRRRSSS